MGALTVYLVAGSSIPSKPMSRSSDPQADSIPSADSSGVTGTDARAKLIGEPIAGTGLGSNYDPLPYWQYPYRVAHGVCLTADGQYSENVTQNPDVLVRADREAL